MLQFNSGVLNQMKDLKELVSHFVILHSVISHFLCKKNHNTDSIISGASLSTKNQNILHLEEAALSTKPAGIHISDNKEMTKPLRSNIALLEFH